MDVAAMQKLLDEKEQKLKDLLLQNQEIKENAAKVIKDHLIALDVINVSHKKSLAKVTKSVSKKKLKASKNQQALAKKQAQTRLEKAQVRL